MRTIRKNSEIAKYQNSEIMTNVLLKTNFDFPGQKSVYHGKVRDVYNINDQFLVMVASDRISAFDVVLPRGIPFKGQVLNQIASKFLDATADICPNWKIASPDPNVTIGRFCKIYPVEMIIRGYLTGSSWRTYQKGIREICGASVPDGMKEHQRFPEPIITPTTKAVEGHDEDVTESELLAQGIIPAEEYELIKKYTYALFKRGTEMAAQKGLILVDTKYEFGKGTDGQIYLCDEIHTPDSSRYFYLEGYEERQAKGEQQRQLSKEFVREWLMANGFMGQDGQQVPAMSDAWTMEISERYIELYEGVTGEKFVKAENTDILQRIENNVMNFLTHPE
jgi:phosphoribosylaminoimidazole-succinocarboxamide synthase